MKPENFASQADIIRVDLDPIELSRTVHSSEKSFLADCMSVIEELCSIEIPSKPFDSWLSVCRLIKESLDAVDNSCPDRKPNEIVRLISRYTADAGAICCDVGQHLVWGAQSYELKPYQRIIFSGGHGAMGFSLPAAIGAHYACGKTCLAIVGDGALQMNIQELEWLVREQVPVTLFVMNNQSLGLIQQQQDSLFEKRNYSSMAIGGYSVPDFKKIALAYGLYAEAVTTDAELESCIIDLDLSKPNLIQIMIDVHSRAVPKTSFGEEMHNQMPYIPPQIMERLLAL